LCTRTSHLKVSSHAALAKKRSSLETNGAWACKRAHHPTHSAAHSLALVLWACKRAHHPTHSAAHSLALVRGHASEHITPHTVLPTRLRWCWCQQCESIQLICPVCIVDVRSHCQIHLETHFSDSIDMTHGATTSAAGRTRSTV
jgi:hypothetical protein